MAGFEESKGEVVHEEVMMGEEAKNNDERMFDENEGEAIPDDQSDVSFEDKEPTTTAMSALEEYFFVRRKV